MTDIAFHFGAPDRLAYTCRLLRKASATGARLVVRASDALSAELDAALWGLSPTDFVPHCDASALPSVRKRSAVLIHSSPEGMQEDRPILVNLGDDVPPGFERFQRVIEVVSTDEMDRNHARRRWKHYADQGYAITRHDLQGRATD